MNCSFWNLRIFYKMKKNHDFESGRIPDFFSITYRLQKDKRNVFLRKKMRCIEMYFASLAVKL